MVYNPEESAKDSEYHRPMGQDSYDPSYVAGFNFQFGNGTQDNNILTFNVHRGVAQGNTDWEKSIALSNDLPTESYSYAVGTFSRPSVSGYLNGDLIASTSYDYDMFIAISSFQVGRSEWRPNDYLNEEFDEIRVSEVVRSAAWIKATYHTMYHDTEEKWNRLLTFTSDPVQDYTYIWDAGGNLDTRNNLVTWETETFTYDFLGRLETVTGAYSESYEYDKIGNLKTRNGVSYTYGENGAGPHAVTTIGTAGYSYDSNGNMTSRDGTAMTWDVLNQLTSYGSGYYGATFTYDGDGNRITKETCGVLEYVYVNKYYETVDGFSGDAKSRYYLGNLLVAENNCGILNYLHQDHLGSVTSSTSDTGDFTYPEQAMSYLPFGDTRSGYLKTYKRFIAQHFDTNTGLYYYNARYYDTEIGRFIRPDSIVSDFTNPQTLNRYSYCINNPLKYIDPSGLFSEEELNSIGIFEDDYDGITWGKLLRAEIGDRITINGEVYHFYHEAQNAYDSDGILKVLNSNGQFCDIIDIINSSQYALQSALLESWNPQATYYFGTGYKGKWDRVYFTGAKMDWNEIGQRFAEADWEKLGKTTAGALGIATGTIGTVYCGTLAFTGVAAPIAGPFAQAFYGLTINSINYVTDGELALDSFDGLLIPWGG